MIQISVWLTTAITWNFKSLTSCYTWNFQSFKPVSREISNHWPLVSRDISRDSYFVYCGCKQPSQRCKIFIVWIPRVQAIQVVALNPKLQNVQKLLVMAQLISFQTQYCSKFNVLSVVDVKFKLVEIHYVQHYVKHSVQH